MAAQAGEEDRRQLALKRDRQLPGRAGEPDQQQIDPGRIRRRRLGQRQPAIEGRLRPPLLPFRQRQVVSRFRELGIADQRRFEGGARGGADRAVGGEGQRFAQIAFGCGILRFALERLVEGVRRRRRPAIGEERPAENAPALHIVGPGRHPGLER